MKKTEVIVHINGDLNCYYFEKDREALMKVWNNHILAVGYLTMQDELGDWVIINPSKCSVIEINEIEA